MLPVGFHMGVFIQIVHQRAGTGAVGQAAIRAVRAEVFTAEAVLREAAQKSIASVITGIGHQQLIGFGAKARMGRVNGGLQIADGA